MATILYVRPKGEGWGPITAMARLAATHLDAELVEIEDHPLTRFDKAKTLLPRLHGSDALLVIAPVPEALNYVVEAPGLRAQYRTVVGWVIDCWWTDRIPVSVTRGRVFDRLLVTEKCVVPEWSAAARVPVHWMPLGTDVLGMIRRHGRAGLLGRPTDLQRMGRQPEAWENDETNASRCERLGLTYGGRPPFGDSHEASYANVLTANAQAKALLAFTNLASPAGYTHPTREYVTSRWLDALALGTLVVGQRPREAGSDELLWPGATLDISATDVEVGLEAVRRRLDTWTPADARAIQDEALRRLDWRWRFRDIAEILGGQSATLARELDELARMIEASRS